MGVSKLKTFDKEYKIMAVKRVKESGKSVAEIARELDMSSYSSWMGK